MKIFLAILLYGVFVLSGQPPLWAAEKPSSKEELDKNRREIEKSMQTLEAVQKQHLGALRSPKNPQEWKELDRDAAKGPEACYRWLEVFSEATLAKTMRGRSWQDLGEPDGIGACRKAAAKVAEAQRKQAAANLLSSLGNLRSALAVYYGAHEGVYPEFLEQLVPKYLPAIPPVPLEEHAGTESQVRKLAANMATDTGGWGYVGDPKSSDYGTIIINCTHPHRGKPLADY